MDGAAGGGYLEVVRWLAANRREGCSTAAFEMASAGGHLDVITVRKRYGAVVGRNSSVLVVFIRSLRTYPTYGMCTNLL